MQNIKSQITVAILTLGLFASNAAAVDYFVATTGSDANAGTIDAPFATLLKARDTVRALKTATGGVPAEGVNIWIRGGVYSLTQPLILSSADSGNSTSRVTYSAYGNEKVSISGGTEISGSAFQTVTSSDPNFTKIPTAARGYVQSVNLPALGLTDFGTMSVKGYSTVAPAPMEFFVDGRPGTIARWPNKADALTRTGTILSTTQFAYTDARIQKWATATNAWVHGFWTQPWADYHLPVSSVNTGASPSITLGAQPPAFGMMANKPFYIYNLLEELDEPGEYYIDRTSGNLYFWPKVPITGSRLAVSILSDSIIKITTGSYITIQNVTIENSRASLISVDSGSYNTLSGLLLRNSGTTGVWLSGWFNTVTGCEIVNTGTDGIIATGGTRSTLTDSGLQISNNRLHKNGRILWSYHPGVTIYRSIGITVSNNLIDDEAHSGITFDGNNHKLISNEVRNVCQETSDCGAIYSVGDWSARGNLIKNNFVHHIVSNQVGFGAHAIFFDRSMSGTVVDSNIIYKDPNTGIMSNGGRDITMRNNLIGMCGTAHFNSDWARSASSPTAPDFYNGIWNDAVDYQSSPWLEAYPALAAIPNTWAQVLTGLWRNPQNCTFDSNGGWGNSNWIAEGNTSGTGVFSLYTSIANNSSTLQPLFSEQISFDRSLRTATLSSGLVGSTPVPFSTIGRIQTGAQALEAPEPVELEEITWAVNTATLRWADFSNLPRNEETAFYVERRNIGAAKWERVLTCGQDTNDAIITGLAPNTSYAFRIRAVNAVGESLSNEITGTTAPKLVRLTPVRYEAETAAVVVADVGTNGKIAASDATLDSVKSLTMYDVGDSVNFTVPIATAGLYQVSARVRSGSAINSTILWPDGYVFKLDGNPITLVGDATTLSALDPSYGKCFWGTMFSSSVTLTAGSHVVNVKIGSAWSVLDYIEVTPVGAAPVTKYSDWLNTYFASDQIADANISGQRVSVLADGYSNLMKYGLGLSPWTATSSSKISVSVYNGKLEARFQKPGAITDLTYSFQVSDDGFKWVGLTPTVESTTNGINTMLVRDTTTSFHRFGRLVVQSTTESVWSEIVQTTATIPATSTVANQTALAHVEAEDNFTIVSDVGTNGPITIADTAVDNVRSIRLYDPADEVRFSLTNATDGYYILRFRVRSGGGSNSTAYIPYGYKFKLNATNVTAQGIGSSISAYDTGNGGSYWGTLETAPLRIAAGAFTVNVAAAYAWGALDYVELVPVTPGGANFASWQIANFNENQRASMYTSGATSSALQDGYSNLIKYSLGTPAFSTVTSVPTASTSNNRLTLVYTRPAKMTSLIYTVQVSTDQTSWTSIPDTTVALSGSTETVTATDFTGLANQYARLIVTDGTYYSVSPVFSAPITSGLVAKAAVSAALAPSIFDTALATANQVSNPTPVIPQAPVAVEAAVAPIPLSSAAMITRTDFSGSQSPTVYFTAKATTKVQLGSAVLNLFSEVLKDLPTSPKVVLYSTEESLTVEHPLPSFESEVASANSGNPYNPLQLLTEELEKGNYRFETVGMPFGKQTVHFLTNFGDSLTSLGFHSSVASLRPLNVQVALTESSQIQLLFRATDLVEPTKFRLKILQNGIESEQIIESTSPTVDFTTNAAKLEGKLEVTIELIEGATSSIDIQLRSLDIKP